ncbi:hypothetical protein T265_04506 [Opisthorchis viverrini]|uniref:Uncharacterized protein n=1 Tax=Opisthorchis viverrini TaxID=6198 RepID=A0A074ZSC3_OPIVI|nr:hypothetical protein T265_04506 [Opisthorchis viverrini]KER28717.1 hypothetical protein T265_04506 [Opisthorchis viverrini]
MIFVQNKLLKVWALPARLVLQDEVHLILTVDGWRHWELRLLVEISGVLVVSFFPDHLNKCLEACTPGITVRNKFTSSTVKTAGARNLEDDAIRQSHRVLPDGEEYLSSRRAEIRHLSLVHIPQNPPGDFCRPQRQDKRKWYRKVTHHLSETGINCNVHEDTVQQWPIEQHLPQEYAVGATRLPGWGPRDPHCAWLETLQDMAANRCQWRSCSQLLSRLPELSNKSWLYGSEAYVLNTDVTLSMMMMISRIKCLWTIP